MREILVRAHDVVGEAQEGGKVRGKLGRQELQGSALGAGNGSKTEQAGEEPGRVRAHDERRKLAGGDQGVKRSGPVFDRDCRGP
jgi:hypothetical protein